MIYHQGPEGTENHGGYFQDEIMIVDGRKWIHCVFKDCVLTREDPDTFLYGAIYDRCTFVGKGWPNMSQGIGWWDVVIA